VIVARGVENGGKRIKERFNVFLELITHLRPLCMCVPH
jgi:hypothetical protein